MVVHTYLHTRTCAVFVHMHAGNVIQRYSFGRGGQRRESREREGGSEEEEGGRECENPGDTRYGKLGLVSSFLRLFGLM